MYKKARGSALIIAFLLVAAVGGSALLIGRLFLIDQSLMESYENAAVAYYAAESGLEEAMLRYRYDRNTDLPTNQSLVLRTNLTQNDARNVLATDNFNLNSTDKRYDLKMGYRSAFYGNDVNQDRLLSSLDLRDVKYKDDKDYVIVRDEAIKLEMKDTLRLNDNDATFYVKPLALYSADKQKAFIEAKLTGKRGGKLYEYKKALIFTTVDGRDPTVFPKTEDIFSMRIQDGIYSVNYLKKAIAGSDFLFNENEDLTLFLKPVNVSVAIGIVPNNSNIVLPYTTVKSTGYFGNSTRTLSLKIDRQSGTVYDLFDYVIYDAR